MIVDSIQGWILHSRLMGDTSVLLTLLTENQGLLRCLYKGARSIKKKSVIQPFIPLWVSLQTKGEWHYARQIEQSSPAVMLTKDALFSALYLNELMYKVLNVDEPLQGLYEHYAKTLKSLSFAKNKLAIEPPLRSFEKHLLTVTGCMMSLQEDIHGQFISPNQSYDFLSGSGFSPNDAGRVQGQHILAFAEDDFSDEAALKTIKWFMRKSIDYLLDGQSLNARQFYSH